MGSDHCLRVMCSVHPIPPCPPHVFLPLWAIFCLDWVWETFPQGLRSRASMESDVSPWRIPSPYTVPSSDGPDQNKLPKAWNVCT